MSSEEFVFVFVGKFSKKNQIGHPSVGQSNSQIEESPNKANFQVSVLIGSLLIAPMFLIIIITVFVRYCNAGKYLLLRFYMTVLF